MSTRSGCSGCHPTGPECFQRWGISNIVHNLSDCEFSNLFHLWHVKTHLRNWWGMQTDKMWQYSLMYQDSAELLIRNLRVHDDIFSRLWSWESLKNKNKNTFPKYSGQRKVLFPPGKGRVRHCSQQIRQGSDGRWEVLLTSRNTLLCKCQSTGTDCSKSLCSLLPGDTQNLPAVGIPSNLNHCVILNQIIVEHAIAFPAWYPAWDNRPSQSDFCSCTLLAILGIFMGKFGWSCA